MHKCMHVLRYKIFIANNRLASGKAGIIEIILEAMKKHMNKTDDVYSVSLCENGCTALTIITMGGEGKQILYSNIYYHKNTLHQKSKPIYNLNKSKHKINIYSFLF